MYMYMYHVYVYIMYIYIYIHLYTHYIYGHVFTILPPTQAPVVAFQKSRIHGQVFLDIVCRDNQPHMDMVVS